MYIERTLEKTIKKANEQFPIIMLVGARQVGKSTLLQHLAAQDYSHVTLDDPILANLAREEPKLFLQRFPPPVLIDEIQYAPELLPYIKIDVDKKQLPGQYWLTGSQQFQLMKGVSESLAGRVGIVDLLGLSRWEVQGLANLQIPFLPTEKTLQTKLKNTQPLSLDELYQTIWRGSFPKMCCNKKFEKNLFYSSYLQTYLQRDVRDLAQVGDESAFLKFLKNTAARTGQLLNLTDLARDTDISPNTAKQWLSILQTSGIIYLLEPYHNNLSKRLIKAPKLYFCDTGLCSYLTQWSDAKTLETGAMSRAILKTFVIMEIIKSYWHNGLQAPLYYYRDKDKKEIDLLIVQNQTLYPVEIKKITNPSKDSVKHFKVLEKFKMDIGMGTLVCLVDTLLPINETIQAIPVNLV